MVEHFGHYGDLLRRSRCQNAFKAANESWFTNLFPPGHTT